MSLLNPPQAIGTGLAVAMLVIGIEASSNPSVADVRLGEPNDPNLSGARRAASWKAAAIVAVVSLLTRDPTVLTIGGSTLIGIDWTQRHANAFNPLLGRANTLIAGGAAVPMDDAGYLQAA